MGDNGKGSVGFCFYYDWVDSLNYNDPADAWSVVVALKNYFVDGKNPIDNVEKPLKALVSTMYQQIKRAEAKSENGRKGAEVTNRKRRTSADSTPTVYRQHTDSTPTAERTHTDSTETETETDTDTGTDTQTISPPIPPSRGDGDGQSAIIALVDEAPLSDTVKAKLHEWLAYRGKSAYKAQGVKTLISRTKKAVEAHGENAVCNLIDDSIANAYKGIIWEKLDGQRENARTDSGGSFDTDDFFNLALNRGLRNST